MSEPGTAPFHKSRCPRNDPHDPTVSQIGWRPKTSLGCRYDPTDSSISRDRGSASRRPRSKISSSVPLMMDTAVRILKNSCRFGVLSIRATEVPMVLTTAATAGTLVQKMAEVYPGLGRRWHMSGHAPIQPDLSSPGLEIRMQSRSFGSRLPDRLEQVPVSVWYPQSGSQTHGQSDLGGVVLVDPVERRGEGLTCELVHQVAALGVRDRCSGRAVGPTGPASAGSRRRSRNEATTSRPTRWAPAVAGAVAVVSGDCRSLGARRHQRMLAHLGRVIASTAPVPSRPATFVVFEMPVIEQRSHSVAGTAARSRHPMQLSCQAACRSLSAVPGKAMFSS